MPYPTDSRTCLSKLLSSNFGWNLLLALLISGTQSLAVNHALRFEREAVLNGEVLRTLTGHLVHLGFNHALINAAACVVLGWLFPHAMGFREWLITLLGSALAISIGLTWLVPVDWYVGFSGVLHGLFVVYVLLGEMRWTWRLGLLAGLTVKLLYEVFWGASPATEAFIGGNVIENAHWLGAVSGGLLAMGFTVHRRRVTGDVEGA